MSVHGEKRMRSGICPNRLDQRALHLVPLALCLLIASLSVGCWPAIVRVPVAAEDIAQSNTLAQEGDVAYARKDYYAALIKYLEAGRLNPNSWLVNNRIGIAYSRLKFYTEAIAAFDRSIALNPKYPYAYNNIGSVYFAASNKKRAEANFRKAIAIKDDEASFHINLGTLYFENKKYEKGLQEWRKGLRLDPDIVKRSEDASLVAASSQKNSAEKSYFTARLYAAMGNVERAVENLQQALSNGFTNLEAIRTEKDFDPIRQDEKFLAFMRYAAQVLKL
jgi:tetratricopeptide (TPR) repeat protein